MERKKRNTIILIAVLAVALLAGFVIQKVFLSASGVEVVLQLEGRELERLDIDKNADFVVRSWDGGFNHVHIEDGAVWVTDADCGDQTCVRTGKAWQQGQVIACLPHRLIIYVEGER